MSSCRRIAGFDLGRVVAVVGAVLLTAVLVVVPGHLGPVGESAVAGVASPSERARASGVRVFDAADSSETTTSWANPDGTYTYEFSSLPVRGRRGRGSGGRGR
jgi:hypothetical protein